MCQNVYEDELSVSALYSSAGRPSFPHALLLASPLTASRTSFRSISLLIQDWDSGVGALRVSHASNSSLSPPRDLYSSS